MGYPMDFINNSILLAGVEIGTHYYWEIAGFSLHGQVFIVSWVVIGLLLTAAFLGASDPKRIPESWQNFMEATVEFTQDIARNQLGESSYRTWLPLVSTMFLFIFGCNWAGAIIPWKLILLPINILQDFTKPLSLSFRLFGNVLADELTIS